MWLTILGLAGLALAAMAVAAGFVATQGVVGHFAPSFKAVPADYGLAAEVVSFPSIDGTDLKGWWIPAQGTSRGTVILAHGNGGNRSSMLSGAAFLAANGYNAFPVDLRAHGESAGNYMTPGYMEALDILGAVKAAKRRVQKGPFVAFGHSYGARASLWAAARSNEIDAVVADCAFVSIYGSLRREAARVGSDPSVRFKEKIGLRMANRFSESSAARGFLEWVYRWRTGVQMTPEFDDAMPAVSQVGQRPVLFIAGENDRAAPPEDARQMYDAARSSQKGILVVPGADHNSTFTADPEGYKITVLQFLAAVVSERQG